MTIKQGDIQEANLHPGILWGELLSGKIDQTIRQGVSHGLGDNRTIKKEDYKRLSHQMLRLESEIVINRAVRQCALEGIWAVTIHDCLVTYPENAERVRQIMVEAFESVGV